MKEWQPGANLVAFGGIVGSSAESGVVWPPTKYHLNVFVNRFVNNGEAKLLNLRSRL